MKKILMAAAAVVMVVGTSLSAFAATPAKCPNNCPNGQCTQVCTNNGQRPRNGTGKQLGKSVVAKGKQTAKQAAKPTATVKTAQKNKTCTNPKCPNKGGICNGSCINGGNAGIGPKDGTGKGAGQGLGNGQGIGKGQGAGQGQGMGKGQGQGKGRACTNQGTGVQSRGNGQGRGRR